MANRSLFSWLFPAQADPSVPPAETQAIPTASKGTYSVRAGGGTHMVKYVRSALPGMSVEEAYGYGQVDGQAGVNSENYRSYVGWTLEEERLAALLTEAKERLRDAEDRYAHTRDLLPNIAARTKEQEGAEQRASELRQELGEVEQALDRVESERNEKASRGSLFSGSLYMSVAIIFVLADVIVARQIVADALKFTKGELFGINESWLFAFGLAMISVLLKPVYDRLVEEKYLDGTGRRTYAWVMIAVASFALATLFVMGAFRSEAFALQSQIDTLIRAQGSADEIRRVGDALASSRLGGWANVLSGMLFAIAGAVSLGMGSRHYQDYWQIRRRLARESAKLRAQVQAARTQLRLLAGEIASRSAEISRLTVEWVESPGLEHEKTERDQRRRERDQLLVQFKAAARHKIGCVYQDGYSLGYVGHADDEEVRRQRRPSLALRRALRLAQLRSFVRAEDLESAVTDPAPPSYTPTDGETGGRDSSGPAAGGSDAIPIPKIYSGSSTAEEALHGTASVAPPEDHTTESDDAPGPADGASANVEDSSEKPDARDRSEPATATLGPEHSSDPDPASADGDEEEPNSPRGDLS